MMRILGIFGTASGLHVNLHKCSLTPIFGGEETLSEIREILPCEVLPFPVRYLGLPLSTKAIPKSMIRPVVEKVAARLQPCMGQLMSKSGRLIIVKSVASAMPIYILMANNLPSWAISEIDALRRRFLWAGGEESVRGKCMVAWPTICLPTINGGLGVLDLRLAGIALQTRWLWLQRTDTSRAWSSIDIKVDPVVFAFFQASTSAKVGNGNHIKFWTDSWIDGCAVQNLAPLVWDAVPKRFKSTRTVAQALSEMRWTRDITGPLSIQAMEQCNVFWDRLADFPLAPDSDDELSWKWTASGGYTASSAYLTLHNGATQLNGADCIWKT